MGETWWIGAIIAAMVLTLVFGALRRRTRVSPEDDARELARTERRIVEIERDAGRPE